MRLRASPQGVNAAALDAMRSILSLHPGAKEEAALVSLSSKHSDASLCSEDDAYAS
jgi:hypothetical protein